MDKFQKFWLPAIVLLLAANLAFTFFGISPNLNKAIRTLEQTRDTINLAIKNIAEAKNNMDAVSQSLQRLDKTAQRSAIEVKIINQQMQLKNEKSKTLVDSLHKEIQKNLEKLDNL